ncbi:MAG: hypothetical protein EAZ06_08145 [Cytophagales bacterium]|nr:MAG: hypothetical protein EAZ06_08145 [Cytophagales bacterium]
MFTSVDYVYYSYVSIFEIKDKFLNELKKIGWENPIIEIYDDVPNKSQTLFIAKDQQLYNWHDEKGYNPNQNGESCILLTASLEKKKSERINTNEFLNDQGIRVSACADVFIVLDNFWEYALSLPGMIEEDEFSYKIHKILVDVLSKTT